MSTSTRGNKLRRHGISLLLTTILLAPSAPAQVVQLCAIEGGTPTSFVASGQNLFASTRSGYIYLSNDSGASWSISHGGDGRSLACLVKMDSVIYAGGWNGVVRSTDGGKSWAKSDSGLPQEPRVTSLLPYDTLLYATTERGPTPYRGGIYVSADMGRHWTLLFTAEGGNSARQVNTIARKGDVLLAGSDSLFRSTDGGNTWKSVLKTPLFCTSIIADGSCYYAATNFRQVYCSTDNGESWVLQYSFPYSGASSSSIFHLVLRNGVLYAGDSGTPGLYRSTDQGVTWAEIGELRRTYANGSITFNTCTALFATSSSLHAGTELGGIFKSTDDGISWTESNRGFHDVDIQSIAVDNQNVYAVVQGLGFFRSSDNGDSWTSVLPGKDLQFTSIAAMGSNILISTYSGLYRSEDQGTSWTVLTNVAGTGALHVLNGKLYATGSPWVASKGVLISSDSGRTWSETNDGLTDLNTLSFAGNGSDLLVSTRYGGFYISTNTGGSWAQVDGFEGQFYTERLVWAGQVIFAQTSVGLLRSTNEGASWAHIDNELGPVRGCYAKDTLSFTVTDRGLALSVDKGTSWTYRFQIPQWPSRNPSASFAFSSNDQYLFIAQNGIVRIPLANLVTDIQSPDAVGRPRRIVLLQNYPNPFNPATTISYFLPQRYHVTLVVCNMLGQRVATLVNGEIEAGNHVVRFDASGLASGVYFYRLQTAQFTETKKLCVLR